MLLASIVIVNYAYKSRNLCVGALLRASLPVAAQLYINGVTWYFCLFLSVWRSPIFPTHVFSASVFLFIASFFSVSSEVAPRNSFSLFDVSDSLPQSETLRPVPSPRLINFSGFCPYLPSCVICRFPPYFVVPFHTLSPVWRLASLIALLQFLAFHSLNEAR